MSLSDAWKRDVPHSRKLTRYQKVVVWAIIITLFYQIVFTILMVFYPDNQLLWKMVLVFSSAISLAGAYVSLRGLWSIESWEVRFKEEVFQKWGIDLDDETHRNVSTFFTENESLILKELDGLDKEQLRSWLSDTVRNINAHKSTAPPEDWMSATEFNCR